MAFDLENFAATSERVHWEDLDFDAFDAQPHQHAIRLVHAHGAGLGRRVVVRGHLDGQQHGQQYGQKHGQKHGLLPVHV